MPTMTRSGSLLNLISGLREESKTFLREEVQLARTELAEKVGSLGRNAGFVAAGGAVAYAAAILLFVGLSFLVVFAFQKMGLSHEISLFSGPLAMGLVLGLIGFIVIHKGLGGFSKTKLAPEKTIETLTGESPEIAKEKDLHQKRESEEKPKPDSRAIQLKAEKTRAHLEQTMNEIKFRVSPSHLRDTVVLKVKQNPIPTAAITFASCGVVWFMLRHRKSARLACKAW